MLEGYCGMDEDSGKPFVIQEGEEGKRPIAINPNFTLVKTKRGAHTVVRGGPASWHSVECRREGRP